MPAPKREPRPPFSRQQIAAWRRMDRIRFEKQTRLRELLYAVGPGWEGPPRHD
jgi:hypothetical protein